MVKMTNPIGNYIPNAAEEQGRLRIKDDRDLANEQKEMFLKLMIAQLKNQDPMAPMDQKDMMASISQMSQIEQFINMSKSMESLSLSQGVGMIGKEIEYTSVVRDTSGAAVSTQTRSGTVGHIVQRDGTVSLVLDDEFGTTVRVGDVTKVTG